MKILVLFFLFFPLSPLFSAEIFSIYGTFSLDEFIKRDIHTFEDIVEKRSKIFAPTKNPGDGKIDILTDLKPLEEKLNQAIEHFKGVKNDEEKILFIDFSAHGSKGSMSCYRNIFPFYDIIQTIQRVLSKDESIKLHISIGTCGSGSFITEFNKSLLNQRDYLITASTEEDSYSFGTGVYGSDFFQYLHFIVKFLSTQKVKTFNEYANYLSMFLNKTSYLNYGYKDFFLIQTPQTYMSKSLKVNIPFLSPQQMNQVFSTLFQQNLSRDFIVSYLVNIDSTEPNFKIYTRALEKFSNDQTLSRLNSGLIHMLSSVNKADASLEQRVQAIRFLTPKGLSSNKILSLLNEYNPKELAREILKKGIISLLGNHKFFNEITVRILEVFSEEKIERIFSEMYSQLPNNTEDFLNYLFTERNSFLTQNSVYYRKLKKTLAPLIAGYNYPVESIIARKLLGERLKNYIQSAPVFEVPTKNLNLSFFMALKNKERESIFIKRFQSELETEPNVMSFSFFRFLLSHESSIRIRYLKKENLIDKIFSEIVNKVKKAPDFHLANLEFLIKFENLYRFALSNTQKDWIKTHTPIESIDEKYFTENYFRAKMNFFKSKDQNLIDMKQLQLFVIKYFESKEKEVSSLIFEFLDTENKVKFLKLSMIQLSGFERHEKFSQKKVFSKFLSSSKDEILSVVNEQLVREILTFSKERYIDLHSDLLKGLSNYSTQNSMLDIEGLKKIVDEGSKEDGAMFLEILSNSLDLSKNEIKVLTDLVPLFMKSPPKGSFSLFKTKEHHRVHPDILDAVVRNLPHFPKREITDSIGVIMFFEEHGKFTKMKTFNSVMSETFINSDLKSMFRNNFDLKCQTMLQLKQRY